MEKTESEKVESVFYEHYPLFAETFNKLELDDQEKLKESVCELIEKLLFNS